MLAEIGVEGQRRLADAKVAVVGAGGLGAPVLYSLASAGVGTIKIIDSDTAELTNLNRQFIHFEGDIGKPKAMSAKEKLVRYNSVICVETVVKELNHSNAQALLADCDLVISCVDNKQTRHLINSVCINENIILIDGGISGFEGYVLTVLPGVSPCYACMFAHGEETKSGVLGAAAGVIGSLMAVEAIKILVGIPITRYLHYIDTLGFRVRPIAAEKRANCPVCGGF